MEDEGRGKERPELRFFTVVRLHVDSDGRYRAHTPLMSADEWKPFRESFSRVVIYARVTPGVVSDEGYLVGGAREDVVPVPYYDGPISFVRRRRVIRTFIQSEVVDPRVVYGLWAPSSIAEMVARAAKHIGARLFVRLIGDAAAVARSIAPVGLRSLLARSAHRRTGDVVLAADAVAYVTLRTLQSQYPASAGAMTLARTNLRLGSSTIESTPKTYANPPLAGRISMIAVGSQQQNYKGHDLLIAALETLRGRGYDVELTLVGDGRFHEALIKKAEECGVGDVSFIRRVGTSDQVLSLVKEHDVFVMPSRTEGMPKALLEAMFAGVFSIGSDVGGIPEVLDPECLFEADSAHAIVSTLEKYLRRRELIPVIAAGQRERALDVWRNHSGERLMKEFLSTFVGSRLGSSVE